MSSNSHKKTPSPSPLTLHTHAFISAFIAGSPPSETLSKYFTPTASIHEHGPEWARERLPFLAKTFTGRSSSPSSSSSASLTTSNTNHTNKNNQGSNNGETMDDYYALLSSILKFKPTNETLPPFEAFNVDEEKGVVSVCLEGGFESLVTGGAWVERFVYLVGFEGVGEGEGGQREGKAERKIQRLDLWADPLSAWVAVGGGREGEGEVKLEGGGYGGVGAVGGV